jgi:hypothetical protein
MSAKGYSVLSTRPMPDNIVNKIKSYGTDTIKTSNLVAWVKLTSGAGLTIVSNPDIPTFGVKSIHGTLDSSASIGFKGYSGSGDLFDNISGVGYRPRPIIESIEIKNGKRGLTKKATIKIKCFTPKQLEEIAKYFNEPGFTLAVEWGWNTDESLSKIKKDVSALADINNKKSNASNGMDYDNFLGNITGGNITVSDGTFDLSIEATGLGELAQNLQMSQQANCTGPDSNKQNSLSENIKAGLKQVSEIVANVWTSVLNVFEKATETDPNKLPFLEMYSDLPSEYQTEKVKDLSTDPLVGPHYHYVGFNKDIKEKLYTGGFIGQAIKKFTGINMKEPSMNKVDLEGEALYDEERFIRFGTLMKIIETANVLKLNEGITLANGKPLILEVITKDVPISAHRRIFSTNKSRLLILNLYTPDFGFKESFIDVDRNPTSAFVFWGKQKPQPSGRPPSPYLDHTYPEQVKQNYIGVFPVPKPLTTDTIDAPATTWGYLNNLYINFDFAISVIKKEGILKKDAILEMLNGMSSAVNNLWDFQYLEDEDDDGNITLTVADMNFTWFKDPKKWPVFYHWGADSPFKSFSLDIDIPAAMKNQIIAKRLSGAKVNQSMQEPPPALWSTSGIEDKLMVAMQFNVADPCKAPEVTPKPSKADILNKNAQEFVKKAGIFIKTNDVKVIEKAGGDLMNLAKDGTLFAAIYNDSAILNNVRQEDIDLFSGTKGEKPGILLPVTVTFTINGTGGLQFGQAFKVGDIVEKFADTGIFQIRDINHNLSGNIWETTVEAQFRPMS